MSGAAQTTDRDEVMLDELAELVLSAARLAHQRMVAAEDDHAFNDAGRTLQRMSRSLRQTLALKAKLKQVAVEREHNAREDAARERDDRVARHKAPVRRRVLDKGCPPAFPAPLK